MHSLFIVQWLFCFFPAILTYMKWNEILLLLILELFLLMQCKQLSTTPKMVCNRCYFATDKLYSWKHYLINSFAIINCIQVGIYIGLNMLGQHQHLYKYRVKTLNRLHWWLCKTCACVKYGSYFILGGYGCTISFILIRVPIVRCTLLNPGILMYIYYLCVWDCSTVVHY